jgi:branched-chain amino acid transport system substrate-binding protein
MVIAERAAMITSDVVAWGGELPLGVCVLVGWTPTIKAPGIGDTTPQSLNQRWMKASGQPMHQLVGWGYCEAQILFDAIERAGTLDKEEVNQALAETDVMTVSHRAKFDLNQFSRVPICWGQWFKADSPHGWDLKVIFSQHDFYPVAAKPLFPIPYK